MTATAKVAFVTGAGSGIGRAAAVLFAREGARVVVADNDRRGGEESVALAGAEVGEAAFVETDVTVPESVQAAIAAAVSRFGRLDVLYNNAGGSTGDDGPVTEAPDREFWRAITLDLYGTFLVSKYGIPAT